MQPFKENIMEPEKLTVSRRDAASLLSVSLRTVDYLLAKNKLKSIRIGKRVLIPLAALRRLASGALK
jgi:excisionase family DNA binding protein